MKEMMNILLDMVKHGYCLFNETPEEFLTRMVSYGFTAEDMANFRNNFFKAKGIA